MINFEMWKNSYKLRKMYLKYNVEIDEHLYYYFPNMRWVN